MPGGQTDFAFWDPRRPWRMAALTFLCIASFVPFWVAIEILSFGTADVGFAVRAAAVLSAFAVIAGVWSTLRRRARYPPEERGSFRGSEVLAAGIAVAIAALITLGGARSFYASDKPAQHDGASAGSLCEADGIRFAGMSSQGGEVCFTLTPDGRALIEDAYRFLATSGCAHAEGSVVQNDHDFFVQKDALDASGHVETSDGVLATDGLRATIRGSRASGVLSNGDICPVRTFKRSASRVR